MITKGIVEELKGYQAKVRLPIYDGLANTKNATSNENLSYATVCVTTNLNNSLNVGDIVYVSFEDNDKGKPVILGQLYKEEMNTLADIKLNSANINQLTVNKNASLPQNTSIGSISSKEIAALSGIKDNIQNQIDNSIIYSQSIISNPNLLINGDFRVNQRGKTSYIGTGYTVDRWRNVGFKNLTVTPLVKGLRLEDTVDTGTGYILSYKFEDKNYIKLQGKTITMSLKVNANSGTNIYLRLMVNGSSVADTQGTSATGIFSKTITLPETITSFEIQLRKSSGALNIEVEYIKLEIGSVATAYSPRPYAEELALCQRYYYKMRSTNNYGNYANVIYYSDTRARQTLNFPQTMRINPTFSQNGNFQVATSTGLLPVTAWDTQGFFGNALVITATTSSVNRYSVGLLQANNDVNTYLEFDAEIY